jgi:hypothetical protein
LQGHALQNSILLLNNWCGVGIDVVNFEAFLLIGVQKTHIFGVCGGFQHYEKQDVILVFKNCHLVL